MRVALRCASGYLTAEGGGEAEPKRGLVTANRREIGAWETWIAAKQGGGIALQSVNGFYLCAEGGGGSVVYANRVKADGWETWTPLPALIDGAIITLRSDNGHALSVSKVGDHVVDTVGTATPFTVEVLDADAPTPPAPGGPRLARLTRIQGHRMVSETGELIFGRGASAFLLFKKFLDGDDITPQLRQLSELKPRGCNLIRVMGMFESLGGFNPKAYADYYDRIVPFCDRCASFGIYVLWTACAATGKWFTEDEAFEHIRRSRDEAKKASNTLFSPVNEQGQHNNSIDRARVCRELVNADGMGHMLYDTGSFGSDIPCEPPFGTHVVLHVNRRYPNAVKDSCILDHPNYVNDSKQVGLDEPARYGTSDDPNGNPSTEQAADAAGTAYTALFWVFHSMQGEKGEILTGNTLDCAKAAFGAMPQS